MNQILLFVIDRWRSTAGGIQTVNRELATAIAAEFPDVDCRCLVTYAEDRELQDAKSKRITLIAGKKEGDWPSALLGNELEALRQQNVIGVVGHGLITGPIAGMLASQWFPRAAFVHVVHTVPMITEALKEYRQDRFVQERERRVDEEVGIASRADIIACIGPRIHRYMKDSLAGRASTKDVLLILCGIETGEIMNPPTQPTVLYVGRTDSIVVKGLDIFANTAGYVTQLWRQNAITNRRPLPDFVVRGAFLDPESLQRSLQTLSDKVHPGARIIVRPYTANNEVITADFRQASIFTLTSREEGFGLVACEAISHGIPAVLSCESGIAETIRVHSHNHFLDIDQFLVDMHGTAFDVGVRFAAQILKIFENEDHSRARSRRLRDILAPTLSWEAAARQLMEAISASENWTAKRIQSNLTVGEPVIANALPLVYESEISKTEKTAPSKSNRQDQCLLSPAQLDQLVQLALHAGLAANDRRSLLFAFLPKGYISSFPQRPNPADQIRSDLVELNATHELVGYPHLPLLTWLDNAIAMTGPRAEANALRAFKDQIIQLNKL